MLRALIVTFFSDLSVAASKAGIEFVDVTIAVSSILASKDADEIVCHLQPPS